MSKYNKELLKKYVSESQTWAEVARKFESKPYGGIIDHIKQKCIKYGIPHNHFLGRGWNKGKKGATPNNKKSPNDILIVLSEDNYRAKSYQLKRALIELGVDEKCDECGCGTMWNGKYLSLQVDHIDGNYRNCVKNNLRFLCPNCHVQTDNFGSKSG